MHALTPAECFDVALLFQVETLCEMLDDYQISKDRDLPKEVWDYMREKGFLGMVIPQDFGESKSQVVT